MGKMEEAASGAGVEALLEPGHPGQSPTPLPPELSQEALPSQAATASLFASVRHEVRVSSAATVRHLCAPGSHQSLT